MFQTLSFLSPSFRSHLFLLSTLHVYSSLNSRVEWASYFSKIHFELLYFFCQHLKISTNFLSCFHSASDYVCLFLFTSILHNIWDDHFYPVLTCLPVPSPHWLLPTHLSTNPDLPVVRKPSLFTVFVAQLQLSSSLPAFHSPSKILQVIVHCTPTPRDCSLALWLSAPNPSVQWKALLLKFINSFCMHIFPSLFILLDFVTTYDTADHFLTPLFMLSATWPTPPAYLPVFCPVFVSCLFSQNDDPINPGSWWTPWQALMWLCSLANRKWCSTWSWQTIPI